MPHLVVAAGAALLVLLAVLAVLAAGAGAVMTALVGPRPSAGSAACSITGAPPSGIAGYGPEQMAHAATIVAVGKWMQVPEKGQVIAIAAAIQESGLRNLDHGDRDSLGLFQQRPSQGWGTPAQITDPTYAATMFYRHLLNIRGWHQMSVNDAAQTVQRSATPDAYGSHQPTAQALAAAVADATCAPPTAPRRTAAAAIAFAHSQIGLPYLWGGDGPELTELPNGQAQVTGGFDCSGLTKAAYAAAGIQIPRTAQTQFDASPRVPPGQPVAPGDLVFYGTSPSSVTHVGIAISSTEMINAPRRGAVVRVEPIERSTYLGATRPAAA
jgi:cell wall-associated NlpC family hydrolase